MVKMVAIPWLCRCILLHLCFLFLLNGQGQALGYTATTLYKGLGASTARTYAGAWQTLCRKYCAFEIFKGLNTVFLPLQKSPLPIKSSPLEEALG